MLGSEELVVIGKVVRPHGIKGWIKVFPLTDDPIRFRLLKDIWLQDRNDNVRVFGIEERSVKKQHVLLKLQGIDGRDQVDRIKDNHIVIQRKDCLSLDKGSYYIFDLLGAKVFTTDGKPVGVLEDVLDYPANDVYVVKNGDEEILIPAVSQIIKSVDIVSSRIEIDPVEGLLPDKKR